MWQQQQRQQIALGIAILMSAIYASTGEELLELGCSSSAQCKQFEHSSTTATCTDDHCRCVSIEGIVVACRPARHVKNNNIGGFCPCTQPNAECNMKQDICLCAPGYVSTTDRRRCVREMTALSEDCELDAQCQATDSFALCHKQLRKCHCKDGYMLRQDRCAALVGNDSVPCENDTQCIAYGSLAKCAAGGCFCDVESVAVANATICLANVDFNGDCVEDAQCQRSAGVGATCIEGHCDCRTGYTPLHKNNTDADANAATNDSQISCAPAVVIGKYCRVDAHCQQQPGEQPMVCDRGQCNCRYGYVSNNNLNCTKNSSANSITTLHWFCWLPLLVLSSLWTER